MVCLNNFRDPYSRTDLSRRTTKFPSLSGVTVVFSSFQLGLFKRLFCGRVNSDNGVGGSLLHLFDTESQREVACVRVCSWLNFIIR